MPEESSFYDGFGPGLVALMQDLFNRALASANREKREALAAALAGTGQRGRRVFRVVRVTVWQDLPDGGAEAVHLWFTTNLPPEMFSAEQIATIYRLRWEVEQLLRTMKMVGRLDHLRTANPHVIHTFIYATLLGMVLTHDLCALMRHVRPEVEPSPYRVMALLPANLPSIIPSIGTRDLDEVLRTFEIALFREGANPNPGRPYRSTTYALELKRAA